MGGQVHVATSVLVIALIGLAGMFSLAITESDLVYTVIMWVYSSLAAVWCLMVAGFLTYAMVTMGAGNAGPWNWTLVGLFFISSRLAITISRGLDTAIIEEKI